MAHNLYSIAYQFYKHKLKIDRYVSKDVFLKFVDRFLEPGPHADAGMILRLQAALGNRKILRRRREEPPTVQEIVRAEAERIILGDPRLVEFSRSGQFGQFGPAGETPERNWFAFATKATNRVSALFADRLLGHVAGANVFDIFGSIGSAGALYTLLAPYFVAYSIFTKDRQVSRQALDRFLHRDRPRADRSVKVAHFTDTFYEVNGVAKTLQLQTEMAAATGRNLTVVTCSHDDHGDVSGVRNFDPIGVYALPEYPAQKIFYPPILEMLDYVFTEGFTHIHSATPGPIGLAALLIARILKLPIHGTYHTAIPQYAQYLTGDEAMEELMWRFMTWYYGQLDIVYVPSKATAAELAGKGIPRDKLVLFPRGVDTGRFHPAKRNGHLASRHGVADGPTLLYVGRVSREKNLHLLAEAYVSILARHPAANLVIVGDGPYLDEMKTLLRDTPAVFTGYQDGEDLSRIYASADLFVFPSTTDTFGNVILEAQASGLPVIVTDAGGPRENILPGATGLVVPGGDAPALAGAVASLLADPARIAAMGTAARAFMEERTFEQAFAETWDLYTSTGQARTA
jgi:glycosyltransferase involved in cell wall biosynthesis